MDRVHLINPGQSVIVGNRRLTAVRPPVYDSPITTGFVEDRSGILFSTDCFGALLPAVPDDAADLDTDVLQAGAGPLGDHRLALGVPGWIETSSATPSTRCAIEPTMVCSSHLPPAPGAMLDLFVESLAMVPAADSFVGPDHGALEAMLAGMSTSRLQARLTVDSRTAAFAASEASHNDKANAAARCPLPPAAGRASAVHLW